MPDRIIKESVRRSRTLDGLSWFELVCFLYLTTAVDDYGRFYRDPQILRSELFPRKSDSNLSLKDIDNAFKAIETKGLIKSYVWDDEQYLQIVTWEKHQRVRAKKSKFPDPRGRFTTGAKPKSNDSTPKTDDSESLTTDSNLTTIDDNCQQIADVGQQMSPKANTKANSKTKAKAKSGRDDLPPLEDEDELISIQRDHDYLFDRAKEIGLPGTNDNHRDLVSLYGQFGLKAVDYAMKEASQLNKVSIRYIEAVAKNYGRDRKNGKKMSREEADALWAQII